MSVVNFGLHRHISSDIPGFKAITETDTLWRFLSLEKFLMMLSSGSFWFARHDTFEDRFEGDVPAHWKNQGVYSPNFHIGYISCWCRDEFEPINMWMAYGGEKNTAICIKSNAGMLKRTLASSTTPNELPFNIDPISYIDFNDESIEKPSGLILTGRKEQGGFYLGKRQNFNHENEVRAYFIDPISYKDFDYDDPNGNRTVGSNNIQKLLEAKPRGHNIAIELNELIDEIIVSPYANQGIVPALSALLKNYGIDSNISVSTILDASR